MSAFKLLLLLSSSISFHLGLGRTSSPSPEDKIMVNERTWRQVGLPAELFLKATTWLATVAESIVILNSLRHPPDNTLAPLDALGPPEASQLTVPFVLGASLIIIGGILRFAAFQTLGPYYTFVQCLRKNHKLITTGPYAVIRHPGYAGLLYCITGWCIVHGSPGSWLCLSGVLRMTWIRVGLGCVCLLLAASVVTVFRRLADEDRYLSHKFGAEWQGWARRVRFRLIPFVY
ncbi:hypothetical protein L210DRAFT_3531736 [Boletus edulis BED1]|uniref:Protein-S-isoprenylcysteine O-methyltransferase n=1 Tax=Boletus edulis BED1 TaxID=1328754 RepID=A0AAD4C0Z0_BOLED|nr:hypothetical protein L210DRAFT_3531736 [Boletus edulis BED1]